MLFVRYEHLDTNKLENCVNSISINSSHDVQKSILNMIELWMDLHPEDWLDLRNKKCRQLVKRTLTVSSKKTAEKQLNNLF